MREKEPIAANSDYGKDEDSAEALLKKHDAFMSDLEAYRTVVEGLREQAQACNVSTPLPPPPKKLGQQQQKYISKNQTTAIYSTLV